MQKLWYFLKQPQQKKQLYNLMPGDAACENNWIVAAFGLFGGKMLPFPPPRSENFQNGTIFAKKCEPITASL